MGKRKTAAKALSCLLAAGITVQSLGGLGSIVVKAAPEDELPSASTGSELMYFVDAGTMNPKKLTDGNQLGLFNSVTEQFFGEDPETGKKWGIDDSYVKSDQYPDLLTGEYTWPCENNGYTENSPSVLTYRYAKDQTNGVDSYGIPYKFELDNGTYDVKVTMATGWSSQVGRDKYNVVLNKGKETEVSEKNIAPSGSSSNPAVSLQTVEVKDGMLTLNIDYAANDTKCAVVNQIYIMSHGPRFSDWIYNLNIKESVKLSAENVENPEEITDWNSDNTAAATVDGEGNVQAVGVGTSVITALYKGTLLQCKVIVSNANGVSVDYSVNEGTMNHIGGGNLHLFDDRSPAGWLSDGVGVYAVRGQDYSSRTSQYHEHLPGFFEEGTYNRLIDKNPDVDLMIGLYYGYKHKTGNNWKKGAYDNAGKEIWAQNCVDVYNDAKEKGISVYSWIPLNEPDLQWNSNDWNKDYPAKFFEVAYKAIKEVDPEAKIQGPELSSYNENRMKKFLTYCKNNNCLPDVLSWHDLRNSQSMIERDVDSITKWMENNGITPMPMTVTEYQGKGYKTDAAGRKSDGNYNTGLTISYLASIERSEQKGLVAALRSEWGLLGSNPDARGDMGEMCDFDTKQMATGLWYVYNAYWDMTGNKVQAVQNTSQIDALAAVDTSPEKMQSGILIGNWKEGSRTVSLDLSHIPAEFIKNGQVHIQAQAINETLATPLYGAVPMFDENMEVTEENSLFVEIPMSGRQACYIVLSQPYEAQNMQEAADLEPALTGSSQAQTIEAETGSYVSVTGGNTSSYRDENGNETYRESGDSVTYTLNAPENGVYNFTSKLIKGEDAGFMQLYVDGEQFGFPTDLYGKTAESFDFNHGNLYLSQGEHEFRFQLVGHGKNSASKGMNLNFSGFYLNKAGQEEIRKEISAVQPSVLDIQAGDVPIYPSVVSVEYTDGTTGTMTVKWSQDDLKRVDTEKSGSYSVKGEVKFEGKSYEAQLTVNVTAYVQEISVTKMPDKTEYVQGQEFSAEGIEVTARYNDGTTSVLSADLYEVDASAFDASLPGQQRVKVIYLENPQITTEFYVKVRMAADKTALQSAIHMAEGYVQQQGEVPVFEAEGFAAVEAALSEAQAVNENPMSSQEDVDQVFLRLIEACGNLDFGVQKTGLMAAIQGAQEILADEENLIKYREDDILELQAAVEAALAVFENDEASEEEVAQATSALITAAANMIDTNYVRLLQLIQTAEKITENGERYTSETINALNQALAEAKDTAGNMEAAQEEQKAAYSSLAEAIAALKFRGDKSELEAALNKADDILKNKEKYIAGSLEGLEEARVEADTVYQNQDAVQEEINVHVKKLIKECMEARILGDVDNNGAVNTEDSALVLQYSAEIQELAKEQKLAADVNQDKTVDTQDAVRILELVSEKIGSFAE